jgi:HJR/Mrr/RecB family endonuclease
VAIREIDQDAFHKHGLAGDGMVVFSAEEVAWYESTSMDLIGTVFYDRSDKDYGYAILAPAELAKYRWVQGKVSIESQERAEGELVVAMMTVEQTGQVIEAIYTEEAVPDSKTTVLFTDINEEVKRYFAKHPQDIYKLTPRKFEELIASILKDFGFDVELTKATRDGGRDIIAYIRNAVCKYLTYVECKKYHAKNKVGVGIVREVAGVHKIKQANKSIIVTTSYFTKDAVKEAKLIEHDLELKDYDNLKEWLTRYQ